MFMAWEQHPWLCGYLPTQILSADYRLPRLLAQDQTAELVSVDLLAQEIIVNQLYQKFSLSRETNLSRIVN